MNIEEFREYCLSFKGVHEKMPFPNVLGGALTFYAFMLRTNGFVSLTLRFSIFVASNVTLTNLENCKLNMPV